MKRRTFIKQALGSVLMLQFFDFKRAVFAAILKDEKNFLTMHESKIIKAYIDTIIPKTKKGPSGTEAGVYSFIIKMFSDQLPRWRRVRFISNGGATIYPKLYQELAKRLNAQAKQKFIKDFSNITDDQRTELIEAFALGAGQQVGYQVKGQELTTDISNTDLFKLTRTHVVQGYFADPQYGGNKNFSAWDSINHICHFNYQKSNPACENQDHS